LRRGHVRDLRPRWACEEIGLDYAEHLIVACIKGK
jgi:glutathione S-transferase